VVLEKVGLDRVNEFSARGRGGVGPCFVEFAEEFGRDGAE